MVTFLKLSWQNNLTGLYVFFLCVFHYFLGYWVNPGNQAVPTTQVQKCMPSPGQACKADFVCSNIVSAGVTVKMGAGRCECTSDGNQIQIWWEGKGRYFGVGNI